MLLPFVLSGATYGIKAELRICNRDHVSHQAENIYHLRFYADPCPRLPMHSEQTRTNLLIYPGLVSLIKLISSLGPSSLGEKDTIDFSSESHKTKQETVQRLGSELKSDYTTPGSHCCAVITLSSIF